ncbi:MAG: RagB/SusD family nutrient uptake outer membrane protein [Flavobacterium sp.]|nr:MAG: RagB/SusD family nutrient uptake outer membrane protein [Flavobacterium sp.]
MEKYTTFFIGIILMAAAICFTACDGFVEVDRPNSQLTSAAVFESVTTGNAAVADLYAQLREDSPFTGKSFGTSLSLGVYADEMDFYGGGPSAQFYNNSVLASNSAIESSWNESYNIIYSTNMVLARTHDSALPATSKEQFTGEALFIRSLLHFSLASVFGDVPYVTGVDYNQNNQVTRTSYAIVMQNIVTDLQQAIELLPEDYATPDRARANKTAAQALLARVYLYNGQWAEAADMASAVINNSALYSFESDISNTFLRGSSSTILQLASAYEGHNTDEAPVFIITSGPPTTIALSAGLLSAFEPGDLRRQSWVGEVSSGPDTWYYPYKYKQRDDTGSSLEFSILFRLAEQYLIRAEARARQGELSAAKSDLDAVRTYAGLAPTTAASQDALLQAILAERRVELFSEYGHRFFDLKRFGKLDEVLGTKPGWSATDALLPLPQSELLVNPFLAPQNPGY